MSAPTPVARSVGATLVVVSTLLSIALVGYLVYDGLRHPYEGSTDVVDYPSDPPDGWEPDPPPIAPEVPWATWPEGTPPGRTPASAPRTVVLDEVGIAFDLPTGWTYEEGDFSRYPLRATGPSDDDGASVLTLELLDWTTQPTMAGITEVLGRDRMQVHHVTPVRTALGPAMASVSYRPDRAGQSLALHVRVRDGVVYFRATTPDTARTTELMDGVLASLTRA